MQQWVIYKHTSLKSGKSYVGMTKFTMVFRWDKHVKDSFNGCQFHFHRAIFLYGPDNWAHEILVDGIDTFEEAAQLERFHIKSEDTFENGYNSTLGGEGNNQPELVYTFTNVDYMDEILTISEMSKKYTLKPNSVRALAVGQRVSCKGWFTGEANLTKHSLTKFSLINSESIQLSKTIPEWCDFIGVTSYYLIRLIEGKALNLHGWTTLSNGGKCYRTIRNNNIQVFKHKDGETFVGTPAEFVKKYNLSAGNVSGITYGTRKSHKGWKYICDYLEINQGNK